MQLLPYSRAFLQLLPLCLSVPLTSLALFFDDLERTVSEAFFEDFDLPAPFFEDVGLPEAFFEDFELSEAFSRITIGRHLSDFWLP